MVSVIMCTYREPLKYIMISVESILNQTYTQFEFIIIVDDPSNKEIIEYIKKRKSEDSRIKYFINEKNLGLTGSLNKALKYAKGNYIARMDADDFSHPQRIEHQIKYLEKYNLDLIGNNIQNVDENGKNRGSITCYPESNSSIIKIARYNSPLAHPTWFGKREVFEQLNGYREIDACEDYDFLVRGILKGFKLGNIQETLLQYRINPDGISSRKKAKQKAALYLISKNYRKGNVTDELEYLHFIRSKNGKRKIYKLGKYYSKLYRFKSMSGNRIKQFFYGSYMFISSSEGRCAFICYVNKKIFMKKCNDTKRV